MTIGRVLNAWIFHQFWRVLGVLAALQVWCVATSAVGHVLYVGGHNEAGLLCSVVATVKVRITHTVSNELSPGSRYSDYSLYPAFDVLKQRAQITGSLQPI